MNIVIFAIVLSFLNTISTININHNHNHNLRNICLKTIIFKEKDIPKTVNKISYFLKNCYNKSINIITKNVIQYNSLPEEDRFIIDFVISSIL